MLWHGGSTMLAVNMAGMWYAFVCVLCCVRCLPYLKVVSKYHIGVPQIALACNQMHVLLR
jgi:hypothetical protein